MRKLVHVTSCIMALSGLIGGTQALAQSLPIDGTVTKIDEAAGKITLRHGPIKKLDMDEGMTMVFKVQTPELLKQVRAGDKVKFDAEKVNGQMTVTGIAKAK
ncbi:MAG TPA: RND transporter [Afipia sp.]|uniref:copper-binding protein n=1 Tax=Afipia sp. NBIMC_P1-C3 TaxID=1320554 RepID=UPI000463F622|nr:RND transporter [Afipia sp.]OUX60127.1 MAG: RND transporter [Afipia sp. TMED4]HAO42957.1 RND transporter [Afipia sp.]HAP13462.1 RND transporter [Afipia sp.]HAP47332.1 RND transporter [Afipia sp.]